ncbi:hypothetical protein [Rhodopseudomonas boonkerdii]|uniref:hypothetical protein n=1 Tax=Rhodopseudomonas boonkerdii TaxID=475937 RepID=UPI001E5BD789|nr:hypothetical protein [Rhodopseudomonas boonkerdii]
MSYQDQERSILLDLRFDKENGHGLLFSSIDRDLLPRSGAQFSYFWVLFSIEETVHAQKHVYGRADGQGVKGARCRDVDERSVPQARDQRRGVL